MCINSIYWLQLRSKSDSAAFFLWFLQRVWKCETRRFLGRFICTEIVQNMTVTYSCDPAPHLCTCSHVDRKGLCGCAETIRTELTEATILYAPMFLQLLKKNKSILKDSFFLQVFYLRIEMTSLCFWWLTLTKIIRTLYITLTCDFTPYRVHFFFWKH